MPHQSMSRYFHLLVLIVVLGGALSAPAQQWTQLPPTPDLPKPERSGMAAVNGIRLWYGRAHVPDNRRNLAVREIADRRTGQIGVSKCSGKGDGPGQTAPEEVIAQGDGCTEAGTCPGQTTIQNTGHEVRSLGLDRSPALRESTQLGRAIGKRLPARYSLLCMQNASS